MHDVLIIIATRGRPERLRTALDAALSLAEADTQAYVAYDDDDPEAAAYKALVHVLPPDVGWATGPRRTLSSWTNQLAKENLGKYRAFFSMGDDHVPRTQGWDRLLLGAIDAMGGTGLAYGDDKGQRSKLATSVMMSADIVEALGWVMLPTCAHYHVDDAWMTLGTEGGCLAWREDVVIEHAHPAWTGGGWDETYASEAGRGPADQAAWSEWWYGEGRADDVAKVAALVAARRGAC